MPHWWKADIQIDIDIFIFTGLFVFDTQTVRCIGGIHVKAKTGR